MDDPTPWSSWAVAIPSLITAASTWYLRRAATKVGAASSVKTSQVIEQKSDETKEAIADLETRVSALEGAVHETRAGQVELSQKHAEAMDKLSAQIGAAQAVLQQAAPKTADTPAPTLVETKKPPAQNFGKVIVKP